MPKEIRDYKSKLFFGLNVRQFVCSAIALAVCVPLYIFGKKYISEDIISWVVIIIAVPLVLMGFFQYNGMTFEQFAQEWVNFNLNIQKRKYEYEPIFMQLRKQYMAEDLKEEKAERKLQIKTERREKRQNFFKNKKRR